jgi:hypothetical protein
MKPSSAKAKGRALQNLLRDTLRQAFPTLEEDDIKGAPMGTNGADIVLSPAARKLIPYSFECKARAGTKTLYDWMDQAISHAKGTPVVVVKGDRKAPLVMLRLSDFMEMVVGKQT